MPDMGSGSRSDKGVRADERPDESEAERLDRNYGELLQEMRVLQAGVQILFAFLLTLPFQSAFGQVDDFQRTVYMSTLVAAALAAICVIGPVPFHRFVFRRGMKDDLIKATTRYVGSGLVFIFLSMIGAIMLAADVLVSRPFALTTVGRDRRGLRAALAGDPDPGPDQRGRRPPRLPLTPRSARWLSSHRQGLGLRRVARFCAPSRQVLCGGVSPSSGEITILGGWGRDTWRVGEVVLNRLPM